jgi:hypothetical protein
LNQALPSRGFSQNIQNLNATLQIDFAKRLEAIRQLYLGPARERTVQSLPAISDLDAQLSELVDDHDLKVLASYGIRGEVFFPVPILFQSNPQLLGYYRLLLGYSQKEFYDRTGAPCKGLKSMEERGVIPSKFRDHLKTLCTELIRASVQLLRSLDVPSLSLVNELQILTLGPLFRGSRNTDLGKEAVGLMFNLVKSLIPETYVEAASDTEISIVNASGRQVRIRFRADPDIAITEMTGSTFRNRVAVEVKGGTDASNRLNRLGEAEKSHLKARSKGFTEFWTISAVDATDEEVRANSPTTTTFFLLESIAAPSGASREDFANQLAGVLGISLV